MTELKLHVLRMNATAACNAATQRFDVGPFTINRGWCFEWATIVFDEVQGSKIAGNRLNGCGHTWIEYKGLCYDAEAPNGVCNWLDLPFWKRIKVQAGARAFNAELRKQR